MFRDYKCYLPRIYRWMIWLVYPVLGVLGCAALQTGCFGLIPDMRFHFYIPAMIICSATVVIEVVQDYFILSGSLGKNQSHLDFLKCSERGQEIYKNILLGDMIRRFLTILILNVGNLVIAVMLKTEITGEMITVIAYLMLWNYFLCTVVVFFCRFTSYIWFSIAIAYVANIVNTLCGFIIDYVATGQFWIHGILLVLSVLGMAMTIRIAMKKMEGSYYDK